MEAKLPPVLEEFMEMNLMPFYPSMLLSENHVICMFEDVSAFEEEFIAKDAIIRLFKPMHSPKTSKIIAGFILVSNDPRLVEIAEAEDALGIIELAREFFPDLPVINEIERLCNEKLPIWATLSEPNPDVF